MRALLTPRVWSPRGQTGTDTIRRMPIACPRVYIAGPGWQDKISGEPIRTPPPEGPSLLVLAAADPEMARFAFDGDYAAEVAGGSARVTVAPERVGDTAAGAHLRVDFDGFLHGSFKHPAFAATEDRAWSVLLCGVNPWIFLEPGTTTPPEVVQQRADASAKAVCDWLTATLK